jgi:hypothetical protein
MSGSINERINLARDFPQIEDITGVFTFYPSLGGPEKRETPYTKQNLPYGFLECNNPVCKHGGIPLGESFRAKVAEMVRNKATEGRISESCQGYENMGRGLTRKCMKIHASVSIHIQYKNT